jgi:CheY-like chemotaxis protein
LAIEQHGAVNARALILVADPDVHVQRLERYFLESAGFDVDVVTDGEAGLERARTRRPLILITELLLPKKDGLSVCRALKSDPKTRDIRVLVFSVLAAEERARVAGADAFLRKPLDDAQLIGTVETLLAGAENGS